MIKPIYGENYDLHWAGIDWDTKSVLDIGADVGSTASYFLSKGARKVYAVEGDYRLYRMLENNARKVNGIVPIFMLIDDSQQIMSLIKTYKPDVVKIDCEGCEKNLINLPDDIIISVPEFIIEVHSEELFHSIATKLARNYDVWFYHYLHTSFLFIQHRQKIIIARQLSKYRVCI